MQNNAHVQCHKKVKSNTSGSHYRSLLAKSTADDTNFMTHNQSLMLILIIGDGKKFLYEILSGSRHKVISLQPTALKNIRAVIIHRFKL